MGDTPESQDSYSEEEKTSALEQEVVILLQGKNLHGDNIYSYLQLPAKQLEPLKNTILNGDDFTPSDYGSVLAAGRGIPSDELRTEMAVTYNLVDVPIPAKEEPKGFFQPTPSLWDEDEDYSGSL